MRTGDHVQQPGLYTSRCCSYETGLGDGQTFPVCGTCSRPTEWAAVTPGNARPQVA